MGWGGAPIATQQQQAYPQQQARFRPEEGGGGFARGARAPGGGPRGRAQQQPGGHPQQRHPAGPQRQHSGDPRQKNQGYRRLWQQVTQVRAGPHRATRGVQGVHARRALFPALLLRLRLRPCLPRFTT